MSQQLTGAGLGPKGPGPALSFLTSASGMFAIEFAILGALTSVIIPARISVIDPAGKVESLALVLAVSAGATLLAQPLLGALSDRTRSRLGRRLPWILGGSVVTAAFLIALAGLDSVLWICIAWTVVQFSLNGVDIAITASLVDRSSGSRRGRAFAFVGAATIAGGALGVLAAGFASGQFALLCLILGLLVLCAAGWYAAVNRDPTSTDTPRSSRGLFEFIRGFWIDPRRAPSYTWMFASRFAYILGTQLVFGYLLYVLTDYLGIGERDAAGLVGVSVAVGAAVMFVAILVSGWASDRLGRRAPFLIGACVVEAVATALILVAPSVPTLFVYAVLHALGTGVYLVVGLALVSEVIPDPRGGVAKDLGLYNVATNLGQILAPILAASLIGALGGYRSLFVVAIASVVVAGLLLLPLRRGRQGADYSSSGPRNP